MLEYCIIYKNLFDAGKDCCEHIYSLHIIQVTTNQIEESILIIKMFDTM